MYNNHGSVGQPEPILASQTERDFENEGAFARELFGKNFLNRPVGVLFAHIRSRSLVKAMAPPKI
jgi:hypothetical protein